MKRLVALGLGIIMAFSLCSCGNKGDEAGDKEAKYGITVDEADDGGLEINMNDAAAGDFVSTGVEVCEDYPFIAINSEFEGDGYVELKFYEEIEQDIDHMPDYNSLEPYITVEVYGHEESFYDLPAGFYDIGVTICDDKVTGTIHCREGRESDEYTPMEFTSDTDDADSDYSVAVDPAIADAAAVEEFASQAKEAVLNEDVDWIVQNAGYPFHLVGKDVAGAEELKAALSAEDSPIKAEAFKEKVKGHETTDLFANSQGVMLGDGELWFGQVDDALRIITINGV